MARRDTRGGDMPLLAWGERLRIEKQRRTIVYRRIAVVAAGITLVGLTVAFPPLPRLVWNASASAPIGLYAVSPGAPLEPGDMVVARLPDPSRTLAARRHYIPANVLLVKQVAATAGGEVCALGHAIFVDGKPLADRRASDAEGRRMPWWNGCLTLRGRQLFLLMPGSPASFDGRYFGVTDGGQIIGKARLLWAR